MQNVPKLLLLVALMFCAGITCNAKDDDSINVNSHQASEVVSPILGAYLELGGSAASFGSVNVEVCIWRFKKETLLHSLRFSVGLGTSEPVNGYIPILLKGLFIDSDHHLELGIGCDILWRRVVAGPGSPYKNSSDSPINPIAVVGYRYEKRDGGILIRAGYTPMYDFGYNELVNFTGVSIGIAF
jgi:hypothetical protein